MVTWPRAMRLHREAVRGSWVERSTNQFAVRCQFVNKDADAQHKSWKRVHHGSPGGAQA
jgi:hypothetical protein